jgi:hypothetical protein
VNAGGGRRAQGRLVLGLGVEGRGEFVTHHRQAKPEQQHPPRDAEGGDGDAEIFEDRHAGEVEEGQKHEREDRDVKRDAPARLFRHAQSGRGEQRRHADRIDQGE